MIDVESTGHLTLQPRAECDVCSWAVGPSAQTFGRAVNHAQQRGHGVRIVTEAIEFLQPSKDKP